LASVGMTQATEDLMAVPSLLQGCHGQNGNNLLRFHDFRLYQCQGSRTSASVAVVACAFDVRASVAIHTADRVSVAAACSDHWAQTDDVAIQVIDLPVERGMSRPYLHHCTVDNASEVRRQAGSQIHHFADAESSTGYQNASVNRCEDDVDAVGIASHLSSCSGENNAHFLIYHDSLAYLVLEDYQNAWVYDGGDVAVDAFGACDELWPLA